MRTAILLTALVALPCVGAEKPVVLVDGLELQVGIPKQRAVEALMNSAFDVQQIGYTQEYCFAKPSGGGCLDSGNRLKFKNDRLDSIIYYLDDVYSDNAARLVGELFVAIQRSVQQGEKTAELSTDESSSRTAKGVQLRHRSVTLQLKNVRYRLSISESVGKSNITSYTSLSVVALDPIIP